MLFRLHIDSELLLLNAESYKIQSYFLDDFSNDYKHLIKNIQQEENEKYFSRNLLEIVSKENSNLKEIHQSLHSSVRIQNTNVSISIYKFSSLID